MTSKCLARQASTCDASDGPFYYFTQYLSARTAFLRPGLFLLYSFLIPLVYVWSAGTEKKNTIIRKERNSLLMTSTNNP
jgi:hypothetical protein